MKRTLILSIAALAVVVAACGSAATPTPITPNTAASSAPKMELFRRSLIRPAPLQKTGRVMACVGARAKRAGVRHEARGALRGEPPHGKRMSQ